MEAGVVAVMVGGVTIVIVAVALFVPSVQVIVYVPGVEFAKLITPVLLLIDKPEVELNVPFVMPFTVGVEVVPELQNVDEV